MASVDHWKWTVLWAIVVFFWPGAPVFGAMSAQFVHSLHRGKIFASSWTFEGKAVVSAFGSATTYLPILEGPMATSGAVILSRAEAGTALSLSSGQELLSLVVRLAFSAFFAWVGTPRLTPGRY